MTDDKDHEYVPHIVFTRSTARIELREVKADLHQAHHDHTELLIERNNMAEALRQVNARLVDVTRECEELRAALAHAVLSPQQRMVALGARLSAMEDDRR